MTHLHPNLILTTLSRSRVLKTDKKTMQPYKFLLQATLLLPCFVVSFKGMLFGDYCMISHLRESVLFGTVMLGITEIDLLVV